ncbi:protein fuzzy homolog [Hyalella azteca]|uniref:Protein fuzzy homolog n=1 Tax=Hyalella azteca TaxID=294128 RepID=A0A8B7P0R7_HYAAZ|nr:protein fuzzy homolog [Hyalella azteca]
MSSITLVCIAASSGVPLIIRHRGAGKPPPFNVVGSLNGVYMFGESQGTQILETKTPFSAITWKTYHDSIRLMLLHGEETSSIAPEKRTSKTILQSQCLLGGRPDERFLDLLFDSLVLLLSIDALVNITSIERLKKDMKVCNPLLDVLLERCISETNWRGAQSMGPGPLFSHLVLCADTVLPPDNYNLQNEVQKWSEVECSSSYACLLSSCGRVLAGSRSYWSLSSSELVLLPLLLLTTAAPNTARDVPVYLPNKSPKVPFRLLGVKLTSMVWCASLAGPTPSLAHVLRSAALFWSPYYAGIETLAATQPYNITAAVKQTLDKAVLGLLVINQESKRCVSCVHLGNSGRSRTDITPPAANDATSDASSSKSKKPSSPAPPPSHTSTLRSSAAGSGQAVHTYQTAEATITSVTDRTTTSHSRALSPSCRPLSPSRAQSPPLTMTRPARAKSPGAGRRSRSPGRRKSNESASFRVKSPVRAKSPGKSLSGTLRSRNGSSNVGMTITPAFKTAVLASTFRSLAPLFAQRSSSVGRHPATPTGDSSHSIKETYVWCGACRVYVIVSSPLLLLVLLPSTLPHPLARAVSYKTLDVFLKNKSTKL